MADLEFKNRLKAALDRWSGTHTSFAKLMKERGVRGASYRSLTNYLRGAEGGGYRPSPMWMREASAILGVREEWLAHGQGPMPISAEIEEHSLVRLFRDAFGDDFYYTVAEKAPWIIFQFQMAFDRVFQSLSDAEQLNSRNGRRVAAVLGTLLDDIYRTVRPSPERNEHELSLYCAAVFQAITIAAPGPRQGYSLKELEAANKRRPGGKTDG